MSNETETLNASCLCGAAKHKITLPSSAFPLPLSFCHCSSCRHMTGSLALTIANLPEDYEPDKELLAKLVAFAFSKRVTQYHCQTCGASMLTHCWHDGDDHSKGAHWDVATGTLEKIEGLLEPDGHEHVADTLDGGFADFLTSYDGKELTRWAHHPGRSEQLPQRWERPDRPKIEPKADDRLRAHCKCGGVEFWVARPSERSKHEASKWRPDLLVPWHQGQRGAENKIWYLMDGGKKFLAGVCSCDSCRLDTGMEFVEWAFISVVDITLDKEGKVPFSRNFGTLKAYNSSEGVMRHHCGICGATVFYFAEDRAHVVDVAAAVLDASEGARAESWLEWWCNRLSFREDAIPRAETLTLAVEKSLEEHKKWRYPNQSNEKGIEASDRAELGQT